MLLASEGFAQTDVPNSLSVDAPSLLDRVYHTSPSLQTFEINRLAELSYPSPWKTVETIFANGTVTYIASTPFVDLSALNKQEDLSSSLTTILSTLHQVEPRRNIFDVRIESDQFTSSKIDFLQMSPFLDSVSLKPNWLSDPSFGSRLHIINNPDLIDLEINDVANSALEHASVSQVSMEVERLCRTEGNLIDQGLLDEIGQHSRSTGLLVTASTTPELAIDEPDFPSVTRSFGQDGTSRLIFGNLSTFDSEVSRGGRPLCPAPANQCDDIIRALRGNVTLRGCGAVVMDDPLGIPILATAKHCVDTPLPADVERFVLFDFVRNSEGIDRQNGTFTSTRFISLSNAGPIKGRASLDRFVDQDIAFIGLPKELPEGVVPARVATTFPQLNARVIAMTFPLGVPLTPAAGPDTFVYGLSDDRKSMLMTVDNFSGSSGSPIFLKGGDLLGLLSKVPAARDIVSASQCVNPAQVFTANEIDLPAIMAHVVSVVQSRN